MIQKLFASHNLGSLPSTPFSNEVATNLTKRINSRLMDLEMNLEDKKVVGFFLFRIISIHSSLSLCPSLISLSWPHTRIEFLEKYGFKSFILLAWAPFWCPYYTHLYIKKEISTYEAQMIQLNIIEVEDRKTWLLTELHRLSFSLLSKLLTFFVLLLLLFSGESIYLHIFKLKLGFCYVNVMFVLLWIHFLAWVFVFFCLRLFFSFFYSSSYFIKVLI